jgi:hypothetical protein
MNYNEKSSLQINYWPEFPSCVILKIKDETIEVLNYPHSFHVNFSNDLTLMIDSAIQKHKKLRLEKIGIFDEEVSRVVFDGEYGRTEVDVNYFSGSFVVYMKGKVDNELASALNCGNFEEFYQMMERKAITATVESFCRGFGKQLVQEPLRFCKCLYLMNESHRRENIIGYVDLGSVLPTDPMGNMLVFALRICKNPIKSELVAFNETKEEHIIHILDLKPEISLESFLKKSIIQGKDRMMLMRIPITLLSKPEI